MQDQWFAPNDPIEGSKTFISTRKVDVNVKLYGIRAMYCLRKHREVTEIWFSTTICGKDTNTDKLCVNAAWPFSKSNVGI